MAVIERFLKALQLFCLHSLFTLNIFPAWMLSQKARANIYVTLTMFI